MSRGVAEVDLFEQRGVTGGSDLVPVLVAGGLDRRRDVIPVTTRVNDGIGNYPRRRLRVIRLELIRHCTNDAQVGLPVTVAAAERTRVGIRRRVVVQEDDARAAANGTDSCARPTVEVV